jgi:ribosomal protein L37AE/L43A
MKAPSRTTSRPHYIVCPRCGSGELQPQRPHLASCASCGLTVEGAVFRTLEQIATLPAALGRHVCECGHPEMRRLPDGVFHCPACGSEVLPLKAGRRSLPANPLGSTGDSMTFPAGRAGGTVRERS